MGYRAAKEAGIMNPTAKDIVDYNPEKINKDVDNIRNKVLSSDVDALVTKLKALDKVMPGGIDGESKIPNYGDYRWAAAKRLPENMGRKFLNENEARLKQAVDSIMMTVRKIQSGTAVSASEQGIIDRVLGTDVFSNSSDLRAGMKSIRDMAKARVEAILNPASEQSLQKYYSKPDAIRLDDPLFNNAMPIDQ
jgi:hypothetical protein